MIAFQRVEIGHGGLPVCAGCAALSAPEMRSAEGVLADLSRVARTWATGPGPNAWLAGADAFAHPELPRLVDEASRLGIERIKVSTAGPALAQGSNAAGSIEAGIRHVEVVVLGVEQSPDRLAHVPAFSDAVEGLSAYLAAARTLDVAVAVVGRVRVCAHTHATVPATVAALAAAGAVAIAVEVADSAPRPDPAWLSAVVDSGVVNGAWVQFESLQVDQSAPGGQVDGSTVSAARAWTDSEAGA